MIATLSGGAIFCVAFVRQLRWLVAHQPPHGPELRMTPDATGFPPSAAWVLAAPYALAAFVLVFVVSALTLTRRHIRFDWNLWSTIRRARREVQVLASQRCPDVKVFSFGATRIDPRFLAVWITTRFDEERDRLRQDGELQRQLRDALLRVGYPAAAVASVGFAFESEESVDRDFGGNWYRAMK